MYHNQLGSYFKIKRAEHWLKPIVLLDILNLFN
jgi:hypothetical protein